MDIFSGLESLGIKGIENLELYSEEVTRVRKLEKEEEPEIIKTPEELEEEHIFEKTFVCPVCDRKFSNKIMKSNKAKLLNTDMDLRPIHQNIDIVKYDVISCPHCGYSVLTRFFSPLTMMQVKKVKETIGKNYNRQEAIKRPLISYDEAIERYKLALLSCVVKGTKDSEKAYVCLKTAWLYRGKAEHLPEEEKALKEKCEKEELLFLQNAYDGLVSARKKEMFPICGMDELTLDYLLSALSYRLGKLETCARLLSDILLKPTANNRIKDKARILKEQLKKDIKEGRKEL